MFSSHYKDKVSKNIEELVVDIDKERLSKNLIKNKLTASSDNLTKNLPVSIIPNVIDKKYYDTVVHRTCSVITKALMNLLYDKEIHSQLNGSNLASLLKNYGILEKLPTVITGTARYDMAITGPQTFDNPPSLIELNLVEVGGMGWVSSLAKTYLSEIPGLIDYVQPNIMDISFAKNFRNIGRKFLRVRDDDKNYEDDILFSESMKPFGISFFTMPISKFSDKLESSEIKMNNNGVNYKERHYDGLYIRTMTDEQDIKNYSNIVKAIVESYVSMYDHPSLILLEDKSRIPLLKQAKNLKKDEIELLEKIIPKTRSLDSNFVSKLKKNPNDYVLKNTSIHQGKAVYLGDNISEKLDNIKDYKGWCVQDFVKFNSMDADVINGKNSLGIYSFDCYVNFRYDSRLREKDKLKFDVPGILVRGSQNNLVVNVSSGGYFIPSFISRN